MAGSAQDQLALVRLIHRAGFGPGPDQFGDLQGTSPQSFASQLLADVSAANQSRDNSRTPVPQFDYIDQTLLGKAAARSQEKKQVYQLQMWWLERMVTTEQPLLERMVWFLHGHWATSALKVKDARFMLAQNQLLRTTAFADFFTQAKAMLQDPAMLVWLDGQGNRVGHANENLGREFLELFALGIGNYTESDVKEASRALTGWQIDYRTVTSLLRTRNFDSMPKTVLGKTANFNVASLVDHVVSQDAHARHMAHRIYQRMVAPTDGAGVAGVIAGYGSDRDLRGLMSGVLDALGSSNAQPLAKAPVEWAVGVMKALDCPPTALTVTQRAKMLDLLNAMGQIPFAPPSVGGWPTGQAWFSATATQARIDLTQIIAARADMRWLKQVTAISRPSVLAQRLGVTAWSPSTTAALANPLNSVSDAFVLAVNSPDYVVVS